MVAAHKATIDLESYRDRPELLREDAEAMVALLRELEPGRRAWLLYVDRPTNKPLLSALARERMPTALHGHYRLNQLGTPVRVLRVVRR